MVNSEQVGPELAIRFDWRPKAEKPLLRVFKPAFRPNHAWKMAQGQESLRAEMLRLQRKVGSGLEMQASAGQSEQQQARKSAIQALLATRSAHFALLAMVQWRCNSAATRRTVCNSGHCSRSVWF